MLPSLFGKHYWFCLSRFVRLLGLVCHCKTQYSGHASFPLNTSPSEKQPGCDLVLQLPYMIVFSSGSNMFLPPPPPPRTHTHSTLQSYAAGPLSHCLCFTLFMILVCMPSVPLPVCFTLFMMYASPLSHDLIFYPPLYTSMPAHCPTTCVFYLPLYDTSMPALCPTTLCFTLLFILVCQPTVPRPYGLPSSLY